MTWHSLGQANWWRPHSNGRDAWYALRGHSEWALWRVAGAHAGPPMIGEWTRAGGFATLAEAKAAAAGEDTAPPQRRGYHEQTPTSQEAPSCVAR